jgi:hypothetical protein
MALKLTTGHLVSERPGAVRLPRQVAAATVLQADPKHRAACGAARSDRLLDPALLHPERNFTPTKQHRGVSSPRAAGITAHLDQIPHAAILEVCDRKLASVGMQAPSTRSASGRSRARGRTAAQIRCVSSTGQWEYRSEGD